ncbi:MAG: zinc-dependent metalloprotease family protein, partial [Saprospiraceae bacterium]
MKLISFIFAFSLFSVFLSAQSWHQEEDVTLIKGDSRVIIPETYLTYKIDFNNLKKNLIPHSSSESTFSDRNDSEIKINLPSPNGEVKSYYIFRNDVFHPELAKKYTNISAYTGYNIDNPSEIVKLSISHKGMDAMIFSASKPTIFIDRYSIKNSNNYIVYYKNNLSNNSVIDKCNIEIPNDGYKEIEHDIRYGDCQLRKFRLALACSGEYGIFHGGNVPDVLAEFNTSINRINGIYEREMGVTLQLIPNTDLLIYLDTLTDPYTNESGLTMLGENQNNIDNVIGFDNYDIGHVYSTGGGGIASLRSPCTDRKARGVTGRANPVGDPFWVDYVAHEMGHQFGGNHTFNNSCNSNISLNTAVEPGSASTIMGYAGICQPNVQNNSDDYFHAINIQEIANFLIAGNGNCAELLTTNNNSPELDPLFGNNHILPIGTPFILSASATDLDNDQLTYCWEQMDNEIATMPPVSSEVGGPAFRSISPTIDGFRYFPRLSRILNGTNNHEFEVLTTADRSMTFNVTVRDNSPLVGCTDDDDLTLQFVSTAGPFLITSQNSTLTWNAGSQETVTWDVANTDVAPVSCQYVDILLSIDGGLNFDIQLATDIANIGSHDIIVPFVLSNNCRIMVKCASSVFMDINNQDFIISAPYNLTSSDISKESCNGDPVEYVFDFTSYAENQDPVVFNVSGLPDNVLVSLTPQQSDVDTELVVSLSNLQGLSSGIYDFFISATNNIFTQSIDLKLQIGSSTYLPIVYTAPIDGAIGVGVSTVLEWQAQSGINSYEIQVSKNPSFDVLLISEIVNETNYSFNGMSSTVYYWRVKSVSTCFVSDWSTSFSFQTIGLQCNDQDTVVNLSISAVDTDTITSIIKINESGPAYGVEVTINIEHTWIGDLSAWLVSPFGTKVLLFQRPGIPLSEFGCSEDNIQVVLSDNATFTAADFEDSCAPNNPAISGNYQPVVQLSIFNGQLLQGDWQLVITDSFGQDGGTLLDWSLITCLPTDISSGSVITNHPLILNNVTESIISMSNLVIENDNVDESYYTIRSTPSNGDIYLQQSATNFIRLNQGDQFSQQDINLNKIKYQLADLTATTDSFVFDTQDNNNRYTANNIFNIEIILDDFAVGVSIGSNILCFGDHNGSIVTQATGGIPPFMYSLNGGTFGDSNIFENLAVGTFTISVKDANDDILVAPPIILSQPEELTANISIEEDTITLNASGGIEDYLYSFDGGQSYSAINKLIAIDGYSYNFSIKDYNDCIVEL